MPQGFSEPEFYGDLVYKLKKTVAQIIFQRSLLKWYRIIKRLAITLMYGNGLHGHPNHGWQLSFPL